MDDELTPEQEARAIELIRQNWPEQEFDDGEVCHGCGAELAVFKMSDSPVCSTRCALDVADAYIADAEGPGHRDELVGAVHIYEDLEGLLQKARS